MTAPDAPITERPVIVRSFTSVTAMLNWSVLLSGEALASMTMTVGLHSCLSSQSSGAASVIAPVAELIVKGVDSAFAMSE